MKEGGAREKEERRRVGEKGREMGEREEKRVRKKTRGEMHG